MSANPKRPTDGKTNCKYVYAIADKAESRTYTGIGVNESAVYPIFYGSLMLLVSDIKDKKIRPERSALTAHHKVIKALMQDMSILPVAFGTIAKNADDAGNILKARHDNLLSQINHVRGKVEMGLLVKWDVPNIFEYFVDRHRQLATLRDQLLQAQGPSSREEKIELGRRFERLLTDEREAHAQTVTRVLRNCCTEIQQNPVREEREVMRLACLVARDKAGSFETGVLESAKLFDDHYAFDFNGPWAPYNFVNIALEE